jgi:hypothetical protein
MTFCDSLDPGSCRVSFSQRECLSSETLICQWALLRAARFPNLFWWRFSFPFEILRAPPQHKVSSPFVSRNAHYLTTDIKRSQPDSVRIPVIESEPRYICAWNDDWFFHCSGQSIQDNELQEPQNHTCATAVWSRRPRNCREIRLVVDRFIRN